MKNKKIEIKLEDIHHDQCDNARRYIFSIKNRTLKLKYIVYDWGNVTYIVRSYNNRIQGAYTKTEILYRMNKLKNKSQKKRSEMDKYGLEYKAVIKIYLKIINKFATFI
jgi:hypothetical protein